MNISLTEMPKQWFPHQSGKITFFVLSEQDRIVGNSKVVSAVVLNLNASTN
jgi:hypothetical protein